MRPFLTALLTGSAAISAVILLYLALLPPLSKRYGARGLYWAGLAVLAGLLVPFRVEVAMPSAWREALPSAVVAEAAALPAPIAPETPALPPVLPLETAKAASFSPWAVGFWVWFGGMMLLLLWQGAQVVRFYRFAKRRQVSPSPKQREIFETLAGEMGLSGKVQFSLCGGIFSPLQYGLLKPAVLLPAQREYTEEALSLVLRHELIHVKQKDLWAKVLIFAAAAVHWFNPLVFVMAKQVVLQCERACDETLLSQTGEAGKQLYVETILQTARRKALPLPALTTNFSGGKRDMKKRIGFILDARRKKLGIAIIAAAAVLSLAAGAVMATWEKTAENGLGPVAASAAEANVTVRLRDGDNRDETTFYQTMVRPALEFYIDGEDLAKVELRSENEFLSATEWFYPMGDDSVTWTRNFPVNGHDKFLAIPFDDDFEDYGNYWYKWTPLNLEEDYKVRTYYFGDLARSLVSTGRVPAGETVPVAKGNGAHLGGSPGQGKLDGYPPELLRDTITITATDRKGNVAVRKIHLHIAYNAEKQVTLEAYVSQ